MVPSHSSCRRGVDTLCGVPDPRYTPRDFAENPRAFGHDADLVWKKQETSELRVVRRAAQLQHLYAVRIRARIKKGPGSLKGYAQLSGIKYDRLVKLLRGEVILRLDDIALADILLGEVSEISLVQAARKAAEESADEARENAQAELKREAARADMRREIADANSRLGIFGGR